MGGDHCHGVELEVLKNDLGIAFLDEWRNARLHGARNAALLQVIQQLILVTDLFASGRLA